MDVSTSPEVSRQYREEIRNEVASACLAGFTRANREGFSPLARELRWELSRYAETVGKYLRK